MTDTKFTPGPWSIRNDQIIHGQWAIAPGVMMIDGQNGTPAGDETDRANAHLIAAAPDLKRHWRSWWRLSMIGWTESGPLHAAAQPSPKHAERRNDPPQSTR